MTSENIFKKAVAIAVRHKKKEVEDNGKVDAAKETEIQEVKLEKNF